MSNTKLATVGLNAIAAMAVVLMIGVPVLCARTRALPGEQRRWGLDFRVRLEQPGGERPIEVDLSGDWVSTISAVRPGEYDVALELANASIRGDGFKSVAADANEQVRRRLARPFWASYRDDGALLAVHFFKDVNPSDRNLLQTIATETQLVHAGPDRPAWSVLERDGAGEYLAIYNRTDLNTVTKRKLKYVYTDGVPGAPADGVRVDVDRSEVRFSLDPDGRVMALDGSNRVRMGVPFGGVGQLVASTETHLANLRRSEAPELAGSLAHVLADVVSSPIVTHTPDPERLRAERDARLLEGRTTESLIAAALLDPAKTKSSDHMLPDRLAALFRQRPEATAAAVALLQKNGPEKRITAALGSAGSPAAVDALGSIARDRMQATGVYSIPLYDILTGHGIQVVLVNAQHTKNVPGRKSDVQECQWLMKLHTYGLLRDSFRLEERMEGVRTIWRLRDRHVKDASRAVQHMQKALTKMNIQLANVISDITGVSGQAIIAAILQGERDPWKLADLKHEMVRASREEVARSLEGNWRNDLLFELRQAVDSYHFAHQQMRECDRQLESFLASLPTRILDRPHQPDGAPATTAKKAKKTRKPKKARRNEPTVDLTTELKRICGVDLTSIDGIDVITTQTILSEIGTDMSGFKTEDHFASWLGLTPAKDITGGKIIGPGRRKVQNRVAIALRMAATTLLESKTYLGARYRHLRQRLPSHAAAIKAMARYLAVLVYRVLTHGEAWVDRGATKFEQRRTELELRSLTSKALAKGFKLVPITAAS